MNFKVFGLIALASLSFSIFSEPVVYGKLLLTFEFQDREAGRESNLVIKICPALPGDASRLFRVVSEDHRDQFRGRSEVSR